MGDPAALAAAEDDRFMQNDNSSLEHGFTLPADKVSVQYNEVSGNVFRANGEEYGGTLVGLCDANFTNEDTGEKYSAQYLFQMVGTEGSNNLMVEANVGVASGNVSGFFRESASKELYASEFEGSFFAETIDAGYSLSRITSQRYNGFAVGGSILGFGGGYGKIETKYELISDVKKQSHGPMLDFFIDNGFIK